MGRPFVFPTTLTALENPNNLPPDPTDALRTLVFDLADGDLACVSDQTVFDRVHAFVLHFPRLALTAKASLVDALRGNLAVLLPSLDSISRVSGEEEEEENVVGRVESYRNALRVYTFFLFAIVIEQEKDGGGADAGAGVKGAASTRKKPAGKGWNWEPQRGKIIGLIANSLEINPSMLFGSSEPDENYLSFITRCVFSLFENQALLRDANTRDSLSQIIGTVSTKFHRAEQSCASILRLLYKFDFSVQHLADVVSAAEKKYGDGTLALALITEIARTDPNDYVRDAAGAENIGRFLVELAERSPKLMATNIGILIPHLGGESYKMRNALVGVLGKLVVKAFADVEGDMSSKSLRLRGKQAMLEILMERCRDVSAYTRSRVLQVWAELCQEHGISMAHWNEVAAIAAGRLEDKSSLVRKSAMNLLIAMLQHNPFGPQLRIVVFESTLDKYKEELNEIESSSPKSVTTSDVLFQEPDGNIQESVSDSCLPCDEEEREKHATAEAANLEQARVLVASLEAGLRFSRCITSTMPTLVQLLASSSSSDVEHAIMLLMRCKQFHIDGSEECLRKMFPLVFSQDKSISEAVENAFVMIYIRKNPTETAANFLNLALNANIGDVAALEFLISSLMSKGEISTGTISALWDIFSFNVNGVTTSQSRGALSILCVAAKSSAGILSHHLQEIIDIGFGRRAKEEPLLARTACVALERLPAEDKEKLRSSSGRKVFGLLQSIITGFWLPDSIWYAAADKAIDAVYSIHPTPEIFAAGLVKNLLASAFNCDGRTESSSDSEIGCADFGSAFSVSKLSRFLFILSHVALSHLVYIESCVRKVLKQKSIKEKANAESLDADGDNAATVGVGNQESGINAELGISASGDAIIDELAERAEKEILSCHFMEKNLIGNCAPFISKLCRNYNLLKKYPELQTSAMLALCRLMIIDDHYCESNLQLLFTVVENAPCETVRSNCTIALGDLAVRFPNLLEPWTENMYARLQDPATSVRKNAVLVLSHLILNDMMKVKGHINEMAIRIQDDDERISSLAKLFFHELSKKGNNPIYNLLPDILGRLSNQKLDEETFCSIMQFLIGSIKKDKQMDALVEKLCNRFAGVNDTRQWEYIAYCLSQLALTEKGMKKFMESYKFYEHVLSEGLVMDYFRSMISKGKKFAKPELLASIEDFEEKLDKIHTERKEQDMTARAAQQHQDRVGCLKGLMPSKEDNPEDETSEVIDPERGTSSNKDASVSGVIDESDFENGSSEVQSPQTSKRGTVKHITKSKRASTMRKVQESTKR